MSLQNNIYINRRIFLLLVVFSSYAFASFNSIYNIENPKFRYSLSGHNYKVYLSYKGSIDYKKSQGFKLFLPNFIKEYNLGMLRFNSIGYINGYLSLNKEFSRRDILDVSSSDIEYYTTNYYRKRERQLDFLFKNKVIPYERQTSLAIYGTNIPTRINKHLNKWLYFTFNKRDNSKNQLLYLVYSYNMTLDKRLVDKFVKRNFKILKYSKDKKFNYLNTYMLNLNKVRNIRYKKILANNKIKTKQSRKIIVKKEKKKEIEIRLNLKRFLYMKEFGFLYKVEKPPKPSYEKYKKLKVVVNKLADAINNLNAPISYIEYLKSYDKYEKQAQKIIDTKNMVMEKIDDLDYYEPKIVTDKCLNFKEFDKKCLNNQLYLNNYIYYAIKRNDLPSEELLLGYGNGKIFNDVAKYYFEIGDYEKSEKYLLKAYVLLSGEDRKVVAFNLGVLYGTLNTESYNSKSVKYFLETNFKEAYFNVGINYYIGLGVKESNKKAFSYFLKASKMGLKRATYNIQEMKKMWEFKKITK